MAQSPNPKTSEVITWDFSLTDQAFVTRWGHSGTNYYKQFLPGGIEFAQKYPVKPVTREQYEIAVAISKRNQSL